MLLRACMPLGTASVIVVAVLLAGATAIGHGASRWKARTGQLRARLDAARVAIRPATYDASEIEGLPAPVRRYFQAVLRDGQPIVSAARLAHEGQFNMGETRAKWKRFTSSQLAVMRRPGFDWDARIALAPGVNVLVHDGYVAGEGILHAQMLGLVTVADLRGTPEAAQGELMRFLAEAAWYPTALLPSQGVRWEAIDDTSARATLTDDATTVSLDFRFDAGGLLAGVRAAARPRTVQGKLVATPWQGRFWQYETRGGMRVPTEGEVAWELPEGPCPYWRGRVTDIAYEFAR